MFAGISGSEFRAHAIFHTHEPNFLRSGTKPLHLISKNVNLDKVAILLFLSKLGCFYTEANVKKSGR